MSVRRQLAQPLSRTFVQTQDGPAGELGPYIFTDYDLAQWVSANEGKIVQVGSVYTIPGTTSGSTFADVVNGNNGATELDHDTNYIVEARKSLFDMGKEVTIGNSINSRLLVLSKVKVYQNSTTGLAVLGYVVSENNASDLGDQNGRWMVKVARV